MAYYSAVFPGSLHCQYPDIHMVKKHYGIRTDRYKLIRFYYDVDEWELYDLEEDPREMNNVYNDPEYSSIREELYSRLIKLQIQYKDTTFIAKTQSSSY